ncbi:MAG TPA: TIGR03668 family PPOX class F420-dependent oxidoreductase [Actinomycetota bacterium]|jgi:PPOX class probable F420-dependent enzyme|nr:TIGR03668 family PPOX class F420-dependent oxidoreductase [Actinomycetota bacterium]
MRRLVAEARVGRLVTVDPDGRPNPVPFVFALDRDLLVSAVDRKPKTTRSLRRLANIEERPQVSILVDHYAEDWEALWWVRLRGRARVAEEGPDRERAVRLLAEKYRQYRGQPPGGPAILVEIEGWKGWSARPIE